MSETFQLPFPDIAALLGGRRLLGEDLGSQMQFADRIAKGLPVASVLRLKEALGLTEAAFARLLGVSTRTLARLRLGMVTARPRITGPARIVDVPGRQVLDASLSDRAYRLACLLASARGIFGEAGAVQWLKAHQRGIAGRVPLDLVVTEAGAREVEALLHRIAHGVYT